MFIIKTQEDHQILVIRSQRRPIQAHFAPVASFRGVDGTSFPNAYSSCPFCARSPIDRAVDAMRYHRSCSCRLPYSSKLLSTR